MIKVALNGGLGNQLFQYAAGRALAMKQDTALHFDVIPLYSKLQVKNIATYRSYELDVFAIDAVKNDILFKNKFLYPLAKAQYVLNKEISRMRFNYYKEKDFSFDAAVLEQPDNTYLDGHFQSEKYFLEIEKTIRKELTFPRLSGKNIEWENKIKGSASISVHIRRGDYASLEKNLNKHGVTAPEYYKQAMEHIDSKVSEPHFFIFTDDVAWVRENFHPAFSYDIIDTNTDPSDAYIDMQLMSLCRHHIICNSTFSWWGAWLDPDPKKIVIAPQKWFADPTINSKDIYPSEWIKL